MDKLFIIFHCLSTCKLNKFITINYWNFGTSHFIFNAPVNMSGGGCIGTSMGFCQRKFGLSDFQPYLESSCQNFYPQAEGYIFFKFFNIRMTCMCLSVDTQYQSPLGGFQWLCQSPLAYQGGGLLGNYIYWCIH